MPHGLSHQALLPLVASIVSAHTANNPVSPDELPAIIRLVLTTLSGLAGSIRPLAPTGPPAATLAKRTVFPDHIICLEDGRAFKMLKRHLQAAYGLTPDAYRKKWGLPNDYPMAAPNFAARRAEIARRIGRGTPSI